MQLHGEALFLSSQRRLQTLVLAVPARADKPSSPSPNVSTHGDSFALSIYWTYICICSIYAYIHI